MRDGPADIPGGVQAPHCQGLFLDTGATTHVSVLSSSNTAVRRGFPLKSKAVGMVSACEPIQKSHVHMYVDIPRVCVQEHTHVVAHTHVCHEGVDGCVFIGGT